MSIGEDVSTKGTPAECYVYRRCKNPSIKKRCQKLYTPTLEQPFCLCYNYPNILSNVVAFSKRS